MGGFPDDMNRNSSHIWLPGLEAAGLPTPRTIVIPYSHASIMPIFDGGECPAFDKLVDEVAFAVGEIGVPAFIRTDLGSAKHSGLMGVQIADGTIAEGPQSVGWVLSRLLEDQEMKFWLEREGPTAILVREWLTLKANFTAFYGLPISNERRFFATPEKVLCQHPYWPADAFEDGHEPANENWRELLQAIHDEPVPEQLSVLAVKAAAAAGGGVWSVDICQDVTGKFWVTDMAVASDSYHWAGCPN
jgi:hypothetical protein